MIRRLTNTLLAAAVLAGGTIVAWAASPDDNTAARLEAVEKENALLRQENAALRERARLQAENAQRRKQMQPQTPATQQSAVSTAPASREPSKSVLYASTSMPMAVKAPPPPPAPVSDWTGFYIGGNIGYGWGNANSAVNIEQSGFHHFWTLGATDRDPVNGVIGGAQIGYNWQVGHYVYGLETDFQGSGQQGSRSLGSGLANVALAYIGGGFGVTPTTITYTDRLAWLGTARGRLGYANGGWLFYGTGGLAYGEVNVSGNALPHEIVLGTVIGPNAPYTWQESATKVGWTVGVGVENAFASHWSWKIEYLYVDLANATANVSGGVGNCLSIGAGCSGPLPPATGSVTTRFTDNIVRFGVNYRF